MWCCVPLSSVSPGNAVNLARRCAAQLLRAHKISVGTGGGLDVVIHALRHTVASIGSSKEYVLLSIDFSNAFNRCSRQAFLDACQIHAPAFARYIHYTYGTPAFLHTRQQSFLSQKENRTRGSFGNASFFFSCPTACIIRPGNISAHSLTTACG